MNKYLKGDKVLWGMVVLLTIISFVAVSSAGSALAVKSGNSNVSALLLRHMKFAVLGFIILFITYKTPYKLFFSLSRVLLPLSLILLFITLIYGKSTNDAVRWLQVPLIGALQTSEISKAALVLFMAQVAAKYHNNPLEFERRVKIVYALTIISIGMIFIHDLSTAILIYIVMITMMYITNVDKKLLAKFVGLAVGAFALYLIAVQFIDLPGRKGTWMNRMIAFLNPSAFPDLSYQPDIAQISILEGAFSMPAPGKNFAKYALPQAQSDYIFAFIIGEWTILLGIILIGIYSAILVRGMRIVQKAQNAFPAYLALGFTLMITIQAFMHMAVAVGLGPVTGQPLPMVSMGGTSFIISCFAMGVILNASTTLPKENKRTKTKQSTDTQEDTTKSDI